MLNGYSPIHSTKQFHALKKEAEKAKRVTKMTTAKTEAWLQPQQRGSVCSCAISKKTAKIKIQQS